MTGTRRSTRGSSAAAQDDKGSPAARTRSHSPPARAAAAGAQTRTRRRGRSAEVATKGSPGRGTKGSAGRGTKGSPGRRKTRRSAEAEPELEEEGSAA